jgi:uncharacterized protein (TIGR03437 family)
MKARFQLGLLCAAVALAAAPAAAAPAIGAILNNYSGTLPGLPNYGIAQGSIFQLWGTAMAGAASAQNVPLQTTVAGTTLNVTVAGVTTYPPLYYVSPNQINGILPSTTPVGTGTITVTYSGQTSATFPIQVVQSAFGIVSLNKAGTGPSAVLDVNYKLLGFTNSANPGDYLNFWGTGLGPVTGDETTYQTMKDMTNLPIEVDIGGVKATVTYHGRSQYAGLDQVQVIVPPGVSGCYVSVAVVSGSGNVVSNYGTIPVAATGRTCSDSNSVLSASQLQTLSSKSTVSFGSIGIGKTTTTTPPTVIGGIQVPGTGGATVSDSASAVFLRYTGEQFGSAAQTTTSMGSCTVFTYTLKNAGSVGNPFLPTYLNAGTAINVSGPQGNQALAMQSSGLYFNLAAPSFIPASGGVFNFNNGSGGPDVGPFTTSLTLATPLVWTNMASITTVTRSQGVTVNWTGGDPSSYVQISGSAFSGLTTDAVGGYFYCTAPVSAGTFKVPASVLLSVPATGSVSGFPIPGSLSVGNYSNPKSFTATGLDYGYVSFYNTNAVTPAYQ